MLNVDSAIQSLAAGSGLLGLRLSASGVAEIVFDDDLSVHVFKRSEQELELAVYLDTPRDRGENFLLKLLHANHLGDAVGAGRVALDPEDDRLLFCARVNVARIDERAFEHCLLDFVKHAAFWRSAAAREYLLQSGDSSATLLTSDFLLRI